MKMKLLQMLLGLLCLTLVGCLGSMKADMKLAQEDWQGAIGLYKEVLVESPDSIHALSRLGFCYLKTNQLDMSIDTFKQVLAKEPGESYSVLYLGLAYLNKEQFHKTLEVWQGYNNKDKPLVEEEINRLMPIVTMALSQQAAKEALANEKKLGGIALDNNTIAVAYLADDSADKSMRAFQKGLAAMIITDLSKVKSFKVVERARLQALFAEMKLGQTGIVDTKTAPRVGKLLKAENIVAGSITKGSIKVSTSVASSTSGKIKGTANATVGVDKFYELPSLLINSIAEVMGVSLTDEEKTAIGVPHTKNLKAFTYFGNALDAMDSGNWQKAKDFFALARKADPNFTMAVDGEGSSPGASAPSIQAIQALNVKAISAAIEKSMQEANAAQGAADEAAAAAEASGGGGGGCG